MKYEDANILNHTYFDGTKTIKIYVPPERKMKMKEKAIASLGEYNIRIICADSNVRKVIAYITVEKTAVYGNTNESGDGATISESAHLNIEQLYTVYPDLAIEAVTRMTNAVMQQIVAYVAEWSIDHFAEFHAEFQGLEIPEFQEVKGWVERQLARKFAH